MAWWNEDKDKYGPPKMRRERNPRLGLGKYLLLIESIREIRGQGFEDPGVRPRAVLVTARIDNSDGPEANIVGTQTDMYFSMEGTLLWMKAKENEKLYKFLMAASGLPWKDCSYDDLVIQGNLVGRQVRCHVFPKPNNEQYREQTFEVMDTSDEVVAARRAEIEGAEFPPSLR